MIANLKPYPTYKDSGVSRFGLVPVHWEVRRIKNWLGVNQSVLSEDTAPDFTFEYMDIGSVGTGRLTSKLETIHLRAHPPEQGAWFAAMTR